jgi:hypothetical protein
MYGSAPQRPIGLRTVEKPPADRDGLRSSGHFEIGDIAGRVGGGFVSVLIFGIDNYADRQQTLEFALAASCLKHSIPGDFNRASVDDVNKVLSGDASGRVQRQREYFVSWRVRSVKAFKDQARTRHTGELLRLEHHGR